MKLLLDQGLPRLTATLLRKMGLDTVHTGEIGYSTASDEAILQKARDEERIVVTLDADFHSILALSESRTPSVIRIRREGLHAKETAILIHEVISRCVEDFKCGAVVTIQFDRIRIRRLPLL